MIRISDLWVFLVTPIAPTLNPHDPDQDIRNPESAITDPKCM